MDIYKLRIKIGSNEFEAEGDKNTVIAQFEAFKELVISQSLQQEIKKPFKNNILENVPSESHEQLNVLFATGDNIVSLKITPSKGKRYVMDAVLLTLLGYRLIRGEDHILGTHLKASLRQSGIIVKRIDRKIENDIKDGLIIKSGLKKGCNYRLTNQGITIAQDLMNEILKQLI